MAKFRKQFVFLIHGMGKHEKGWSVPFQSRFREILRQYTLPGMPKEKNGDLVEFIETVFDSTFEDLREKWTDLAGSLQDANSEINSELVAYLSGLDSADADSDFEKFFWENILDVALWWSSRNVRLAVIADVADQLAEALNAHSDSLGRNWNDFHVIAHSLGTSVAHDVLVRMTQDPTLEGAFAGPNFRFRTVSTIANVSKILEPPLSLQPDLGEDAFKVYKSVVRPSAQPSKSTVCAQFLNIFHDLDPFTWPLRFRRDGVAGHRDIPVERFIDLRQVHSLVHYLEAPRTHINLIQAIFTERAGTSDEIADAIKSWNRRTREGDPAVAKLRSLFTKEHTEPWSFRDLLALYVTFDEVVKGWDS